MNYFTICDNDIKDIENISSVISKLLRKNRIFCEINKVCSLEELKKTGPKCDILIINTDMNDGSGVEFVKKELADNGDLKVIFVSEREELWHVGYELDAVSFILKPIDSELLNEAVTYSFKTILNADTVINLNDVSGTKYSINPLEILYIEINNKEITIHLINNQIINCRGSLSGLKSFFSGPLLRCHSSYVVNMNCIESYRRYEFVLFDGTEIRISKQNYKNVIDAYAGYKLFNVSAFN